MRTNSRDELQTLMLVIVLILLFSSGEIATKIQNVVFAKITWEQIILGVLMLRILYILLKETFFPKKQ